MQKLQSISNHPNCDRLWRNVSSFVKNQNFLSE